MLTLNHSRLFLHFPSLLTREKETNVFVIIEYVVDIIDSSCLGNWQELWFDSSIGNKVKLLPNILKKQLILIILGMLIPKILNLYFTDWQLPKTTHLNHKRYAMISRSSFSWIVF